VSAEKFPEEGQRKKHDRKQHHYTSLLLVPSMKIQGSHSPSLLPAADVHACKCLLFKRIDNQNSL